MWDAGSLKNGKGNVEHAIEMCKQFLANDHLSIPGERSKQERQLRCCAVGVKIRIIVLHV
jgi:hypothetical protein